VQIGHNKIQAYEIIKLNQIPKSLVQGKLLKPFTEDAGTPPLPYTTTQRCLEKPNLERQMREMDPPKNNETWCDLHN
jgi:hypothetical protein